jgi:hypothetical protein
VVTVAVEVLPAVVDDEPALPSAPLAIGGPASAGDGSSSRDRLVRIASMIRDAEHAVPLLSRRRRQPVRLVPLAPRRSRARARAAAVVDLAS